MSRRRLLLVAGLLVGGQLVGGRVSPLHADAPTSADLVRTLGGEDATERYEAYRSLSATHPPDALPLLARSVPAMPLQGQSLGFSVVLGYPPDDAKPVLERWLSSESPFLHVAVGASLLRQGDAKAATLIAKALSRPALEPDALVMMLGALYGVRDERVLVAIRALLRADAPPEVLGAALYQLHGIPDTGARKAATSLLEAPSLGVRALAAAYLLGLGDEDKADALAAALASGDLPYADFVRVENLLTRAPRCPEKVLDALVALLESGPKGYHLPTVIGLLGEFAHLKAVPVLRKLLDDEQAAVSKAAFEALSKIPDALTPEVTKSLLQAKDEARRISAAEALLRTDDLSGLPAVVDVLAHGTVARADAARALGAFRSRAAVEPLIDALLDADLTVRANAYNSLSTLFRFLYPYRRLDLATLGYVSTASPDVRSASVTRLRSWWAAHKDGGW